MDEKTDHPSALQDRSAQLPSRSGHAPTESRRTAADVAREPGTDHAETVRLRRRRAAHTPIRADDRLMADVLLRSATALSPSERNPDAGP